MNNIDPRTMKQLLQLQWSSNIGSLLSTTDNGTSQDTNTDFSDLLKQLLGQGQGSLAQDSKITSAKDLLARTAAVYSKGAEPSAYDQLIEQAGLRNGVDSSLVKAVISAESSFKSNAQSGAGAKGLMQLMDETAAGLGVTNSFDPAQNINGGTKFLSSLLSKYKGSEAVALAAYNAGPGRVDKLGISTEADLRSKYAQLPQETQQYINKVLDLKRGYQV